jgi:hypothetical protein
MNPAFGSKSKPETRIKLWRFAYRQRCSIDIETGDFEVNETVIAATDRLFERNPNAQPWGIRIGHRAVYHFGSWSLKKD